MRLRAGRFVRFVVVQFLLVAVNFLLQRRLSLKTLQIVFLHFVHLLLGFFK
jgi:hypothetical protein